MPWRRRLWCYDRRVETRRCRVQGVQRRPPILVGSCWTKLRSLMCRRGGKRWRMHGFSGRWGRTTFDTAIWGWSLYTAKQGLAFCFPEKGPVSVSCKQSKYSHSPRRPARHWRTAILCINTTKRNGSRGCLPVMVATTKADAGSEKGIFAAGKNRQYEYLGRPSEALRDLYCLEVLSAAKKGYSRSFRESGLKDGYPALVFVRSRHQVLRPPRATGHRQ